MEENENGDKRLAAYACPQCGARGNVNDTSLRWNGGTWEHKCKDGDPDMGFVKLRYQPIVDKR